MATVINNPGNQDSRGDGSAGWGVAIVILIAVIAVGAYLWAHNNSTPSAASPTAGTEGNTINVALPGSTSGSSGGVSASTTTP